MINHQSSMINHQSLRGHLGINWGSFGDHLEVIWASSRGHLGMIRKSFGHHPGVIWDYLEVIWRSFVRHLGVVWGPFGDHLGTIWRSSGDHLAIIWGPFGGEKSKLRDEVLEPKLQLYEPPWGRNRCRTSIFQPRELNLRCLALGSSLADPISPVWGLSLESCTEGRGESVNEKLSQRDPN